MTAAPDILIVGNDPNRDPAGAILTAAGWRVDHVQTGEAAIGVAADHRYALILLDIRMAGLDGCGTAAAVRSGRGASAAAPILAFTATPQAASAARLRASGIDGHIVTPVDAETLWAAVEPWRPTDRPAPTARLAAIFGAAEIAALLVGLRDQLEDALGATETRRYAGAHRLAGIAGTLGFAEVSRLWLAVSEGDAAASAEARISARKALAEIAIKHI